MKFFLPIQSQLIKLLAFAFHSLFSSSVRKYFFICISFHRLVDLWFFGVFLWVFVFWVFFFPLGFGWFFSFFFFPMQPVKAIRAFSFKSGSLCF